MAIEKPSTRLMIVLHDFIFGPSTSLCGSEQNVRGTVRCRFGRDAAAETEQENMMPLPVPPV